MTHDHAQAAPQATCCSHGCDAPAPDTAAPAGPGQRFRVPSMDCAAEEAEIRHAVAAIPGLHGLRFGLAARSLHIDAEPPAVDAALAAIRRAGFAITPWPDEAAATAAPPSALPRLIAALALATLAELIAFFAPPTLLAEGAGLAVAAAAIALAGLSTLRKGLAALRQGRLNINALMSVAVIGAVAIGQWPEAAMVMALYAIAELIEARAVDRARHAIAGLMALAPDTASVQQPGGDWAEVAVADVPVGATIRVRPGARVPLDATVLAGTSSLDQSALTGESLPVDKAQGDALYAATVNQQGTLLARVSAPASASTLSRIIHAVEQAQASRAPTQRFVDRFAAIYTPAVFLLALAVALGGPWLMGWTWPQAIYQALVLLVIACPCALVISTPVTLVSGLTAAARRGVLIKGGSHLEQARHLRAVALDKTGTLTEGRPRLVHWQVLDGQTPPEQAARVAAALAGGSDHPVSRAIALGLPAGADAVGLQALPGRGITAQVDGQPHWLGNVRLMAERGLATPALDSALAEHERAGRTVSLLASEQRVVALFAVADALKPSSAEAVRAMQALGLTPVMLSGDHPATAEAIAREAGITEVRGGLLPDEKQEAIRALQQRLGPTAMCGDGINDAPALAQAHLGIAMGGVGSDIAMEAADVVVMNDDLRRIPEAVALSRRTHGVLVQNIALALGIKAVFMALALMGQATMWMAVFADMGASMLVVFNGLRLLRAGRI